MQVVRKMSSAVAWNFQRSLPVRMSSASTESMVSAAGAEVASPVPT